MFRKGSSWKTRKKKPAVRNVFRKTGTSGLPAKLRKDDLPIKFIENYNRDVMEALAKQFPNTIIKARDKPDYWAIGKKHYTGESAPDVTRGCKTDVYFAYAPARKRSVKR